MNPGTWAPKGVCLVTPLFWVPAGSAQLTGWMGQGSEERFVAAICKNVDATQMYSYDCNTLGSFSSFKIQFFKFPICTMEYYSAIKKSEIMPFAATWMDLEIVILSEVSQTEKEKYHMISTYCIAQGTLLNVMWQPRWEGSLEEDG